MAIEYNFKGNCCTEYEDKICRWLKQKSHCLFPCSSCDYEYSHKCDDCKCDNLNYKEKGD